jgi:Tol biopolymer transport system component/DNA-binding winged helix-turn-helix (wHTH) protein
MFPEQKGRFYTFDGFSVDVTKRLLLRDNQPVSLNPKAFDLLLALVERRGRVVTKDQLLESVWPDQFVEEGNLTVHMSALRKALGERKKEHRYVVTVPGQGYQFVANVFDGDSPGGDVIIEEHTFSRIEVEQEDSLDQTPQTNVTLAQAVAVQKALPEAISSDGLVIRSSPSAGQIESDRWVGKRGRWIGGAVCIIVLFLAASFGFWRYYGRNRRRPVGSHSQGQAIGSKLLTGNGMVAMATISPDGKYFVYMLHKNSLEEIWFGHVNGGNPVQIRAPEVADYGILAFAPDGGSIFYQANGSLFQMPVLGGPPQKVLDRVSAHFTLSPDGKRVAFVRGDSERKVSTIIIADLDSSGGARELAAVPAEMGFSPYGPAWSPDGAMLAIGAASPANPNQAVLMSVRLADGKMEQLSSQSWESVNRAAWLHDGSGIVFHAVGPRSDYQIWLLDYPGGEVRSITSYVSGYSRSSVSLSDDDNSLLVVRHEANCDIWICPATELRQSSQVTKNALGKADGIEGMTWTADDRIVYAELLNNSSSLWSMNPDGSDAKQLTPSGSWDRNPKATADGRYVVFESNRSGADAIWRVNTDGGDLRQLTNGPPGRHPDVTPDSQWILYAATEGAISRIWKVSIDGAQPVRLIDESSDWPRVSRDGQFLACAYRDKRWRLTVLPMSGGLPIHQFDLNRAGTFNDGVRWAPDGSAILYRNFPGGLWRQPLSGEAPQKVTDLPDRRIYYYDWSPDSKQFAMAYGDEIRDAVLFTTFR